MGATRTDSRRRTRRIVSGTPAVVLAVLGAGALVVSTSPAAYATNPLTNDIPEFTPITHSPFMFVGTADPGDPITVNSGGFGPNCNTVTDGLGNWACNVFLTSSTDATVITAVRPDDGTPAQDSEGWEYAIALPVVINETQPGQVLSNNLLVPVTGSGAWPTATMIVTINGLPCTGGPADVLGNWSCTPPPGLVPGSYLIQAQQDVAGAATSDPVLSVYNYDTSTFTPTINSPYDTAGPPVNIQTSDTTPTMTGNAGSAEPFATVHLTAANYGPGPIVHPQPGTITPWCTAVADAGGAWSCTGPPMTVGDYWLISVYAIDLAGNTGPSPDGEFGIEILPPPDAPTVFNPSPGFGEISPFVVNGTVDGVTTEVRVREGATDLCGAVIPAALNFNCAPVLAPGPHTIDIVALDVYGTEATTSRSVLSWPSQTITTPTPAFMTSLSTLHVIGTAPIGSDLSIRVDGFPACNLIPVTTSYDCLTGFLAVGPHSIDVDYTDPWGDFFPTTNRLITIVPTLPAPIVADPIIGYTSTKRVVHVDMTLQPQGTVYVREGAFDLCAPTPAVVSAYSCDTTQLSVGNHTITFSQTDAYGVMSASAQRVVTILPTPFLPLSMKTFGFSFRILTSNGNDVGDNGLDTGDTVTVIATGVPPGTLVQTELHSDPVTLGSMTVGPSGKMELTTTVPAVPPGQHEIVISASAPGYWPAAFSTPLDVHGLKHIPGTEDASPIKQLGTPDDVKQLGEVGDAGPGSSSGGPGGGGDHGLDDPSVFGSVVESPFDADAQAFQLTVAGVALTGSLGIAFLLVVGLPAELLESTIRSNYDRAFGWMARIRRRIAKIAAPIARVFANPWVGSGLTILAAAVLLGFADPNYGFNGASVRLTLAMLIAVIAINIGLTTIVMRVARRAFDVRGMLQPMPAALALVGISVLVSRLAGISPGFLFGVVLGVVYARELKLRDEGRLGALGVGLTIAAGLLAWVGYGLASLASGPGFWNNLLIESLAAITLEALGTLVIALLPIDFLDGRTIFRWSKPAWIGLYLVTGLVFLIVVVPMSGNWGTMSAPIFGWGTLFVVFGVVALVTWALFRRFPAKKSGSDGGATPSSRPVEAAPPRSRR